MDVFFYDDKMFSGEEEYLVHRQDVKDFFDINCLG